MKMKTEYDVIKSIMQQYGTRTPINVPALKVLYARAWKRGYSPSMIYLGLKTIICKNYLRSEYRFPNNDPEQEVLHERIYIEDCEFRDIVKGAITV